MDGLLAKLTPFVDKKPISVRYVKQGEDKEWWIVQHENECLLSTTIPLLDCVELQDLRQVVFRSTVPKRYLVL